MSDRNIQIMLNSLYLANRNFPINPEGKEICGIKPKNNDTHFEYEFQKAKDFLDSIDITSDLYFHKAYNHKRNFIFRGHSDSIYKLKPTLFRNITENEYNIYKNKQYPKRELDLFADFSKGINDLGLHIENDSLTLANYYGSKGGKKSEEGFGFFDRPVDLIRKFPTSEQTRILGLAQHFGVPTRLLDFTHNPYKAIFFATENIIHNRKCDETKKIGLWVIPELLIESAKLVKFIDKIEVKKFNNENIIAQEGIFINYFPPQEKNDFPIFKLKNGEEKPFQVKTLDEYIIVNNDSTFQQIITEITGKPMHFTLPHSEVDLIAEKLDHLNINWITMMPNLEGAKNEAIRRMKLNTFSF
jgi:FRG domain